MDDPPTEFKSVGRQEQSHELLQTLESFKWPVILISGPPGCGKSTFVTQALEEFPNDTLQCGNKILKICHINCRMVRSNLEFSNTVITSLYEKDKSCMSPYEADTSQEYIVLHLVQEVTAILKVLTSQHIILFIDNIEQNRKDVVLSFIVEMFKQRVKPSNVTVILTSVMKLNSAAVRFKQIALRKFTDDEAKQLFEVNFHLKPSDVFVQTVNDVCSGNPQVLQLVASDMTSEGYFTQEEIQTLIQAKQYGDIVNREEFAESEQWYKVLDRYFEKLSSIIRIRVREVQHIEGEFTAKDLNSEGKEHVAMIKNRLIPLIRANAVDFSPESHTLRVPPMVKDFLSDTDTEVRAGQEASGSVFKSPTAASVSASSSTSQSDSEMPALAKLSLDDVVAAKVTAKQSSLLNQLSSGGANIRPTPEHAAEAADSHKEVPVVADHSWNLVQNRRFKSIEDQKGKMEIFEQEQKKMNTTETVEEVVVNQTGESGNNLSPDNHGADQASSNRASNPSIVAADSLDDNTVQPVLDPKQTSPRSGKSASFSGHRLQESVEENIDEREACSERGCPMSKNLDAERRMWVSQSPAQLPSGRPVSDIESQPELSTGPTAMTQRTIDAECKYPQDQSDNQLCLDKEQKQSVGRKHIPSHVTDHCGYGELLSSQRHNSGALTAVPPPVCQHLQHHNQNTVQPNAPYGSPSMGSAIIDVARFSKPHTPNYGHIQDCHAQTLNQFSMRNPNVWDSTRGMVRHQSNTGLPYISNISQPYRPDGSGVYHQQAAPPPQPALSSVPGSNDYDQCHQYQNPARTLAYQSLSSSHIPLPSQGQTPNIPFLSMITPSHMSSGNPEYSSQPDSVRPDQLNSQVQPSGPRQNITYLHNLPPHPFCSNSVRLRQPAPQSYQGIDVSSQGFYNPQWNMMATREDPSIHLHPHHQYYPNDPGQGPPNRAPNPLQSRDHPPPSIDIHGREKQQ